MSRKILIAIVLVLIVGTVVLRFRHQLAAPITKTNPPTSTTSPQTATPAPIAIPSPNPPAPTIPWPISGGKDRVTKIFFGQFVSPTNSPIQPQRFTGYHTGWDFETTPAELDADVPIMAVCDGKIIYRNWVSGYGGVTVESCSSNGQPITALYGHLRLSSIVATGTSLKIGDKIGLLGNNKSTETDGERKHLHFDIHKGSSLELRGYVQTPGELVNWLDPTDYFTHP